MIWEFFLFCVRPSEDATVKVGGNVTGRVLRRYLISLSGGYTMIIRLLRAVRESYGYVDAIIWSMYEGDVGVANQRR